jgi:hypothetical protein
MKLRGAMVSIALFLTMAVIAPPTLAYQEAQISDAGSIKGKVVYKGDVPTRTIVPTKNQDICAGVREEAEVKVSSNGEVGDAIVYLKNVEIGKAGPATSTPVLKNKGCIFQPAVQAIPVGKLSVLNSDPVLHNTSGYYGKRNAFNVGLPNQGQAVEVELARAGQVRVECDAHGWMLGFVYAVANPYYALTGEDGSFEITDVPPGNYTLVANQAYTGPVEIPVTVTVTVTVTVAAGAAAEVPVELKEP